MNNRADAGQDANGDATAGVTALSYEQARDQLAEVVDALEAGGTTLEESLSLWERGEQLAATCQRWLDGARERIEAVRAAAGGPETPSEGATDGK